MVGEAVNAGHPQLEWNDPVRLRDRIVHGYWLVDLEIRVATARDDLPAFMARVRTIE